MTRRWWFTVDCTPTTYIYVKVLMGVSRLPSRGKDLVSVIAGDERKKLFSLSTYEVICKSPRSIEFLQFLTSFTKIWTIGPKIESKIGKKRQFTMERPEPHCMILAFRFAAQVETLLPIPSVCRSVSSAYVPRNATQLVMCLGNLCTETAAVI